MQVHGLILAAVNLVDTLAVDTNVVNTFKTDPDYNYTRDVLTEAELEQTSFIDDIFNVIEKIFASLIPHSQQTMNIWIIVAVVVLVALIVYILTKKIGIFSGKGIGTTEYSVEDDIYNIDFDSRISKALALRDYRQATRFTYLKTLRWLADTNRIDWALFKTPSQYTLEETNPLFLTMTNEFLRIRYGNFDATEQTYLDMNRNSTRLIDEVSQQIIANQNQTDNQSTDGGTE